MKSVQMHEADVIVKTGGVALSYKSHQIIARNGQGIIRDRYGAVVREKTGAVAARRYADRDGAWEVEFADGERWIALLVPKPCGACP